MGQARHGVTTEVRGKTLVVTIERPEVRNAVDDGAAAALDEAFQGFDSDGALSVAILTGAGGTFCAGADLKAIAEGRRVAISPTGVAPMGPTRHELSKPVIAAVEGFAVAGGLELALWCDLIVAARDATFGVFSRRFGVPLIDGGTIRLTRAIGQGRALDLILTGRAVTAEEAHGIGLVQYVVDPGSALDHAIELASQIASLPQASLRADRRSARNQWSLDLDSALAAEFSAGVDALMAGEAQDGAQRFTGGAGRHGATGD